MIADRAKAMTVFLTLACNALRDRRSEEIDQSLSIVAEIERTADRPKSCLKSRAQISDGSARRFFMAHRKKLR
jgi:hypothetical protein